jgi:transposase-like protein
MTNPTKARRRFRAQKKQEAIDLYLQEGVFCNAGAQRLGLPSSSLARGVHQAGIDRGQVGPRDQDLHSSEEPDELNQLRRENRELRREKDLFQAGGSALCKRAAAIERIGLIGQLADHHFVAWLCRQLGVARSGLYAWRQREEATGTRAAENSRLTAEIKAVFREHRGF